MVYTAGAGPARQASKYGPLNPELFGCEGMGIVPVKDQRTPSNQTATGEGHNYAKAAAWKDTHSNIG